MSLFLETFDFKNVPNRPLVSVLVISYIFLEIFIWKTILLFRGRNNIVLFLFIANFLMSKMNARNSASYQQVKSFSN